MKTFAAAALRTFVIILLAFLSLRLAVWILDGNDPAANADIGIGLVPIAVALLSSGFWGFIDGRRQSSRSPLRIWLLFGTLVCFLDIARGAALGDGPISVIAVAIVISLILAGTGALGVVIGRANAQR